MRILACLALALAMAGCANLNSVHRQLDVDGGKGALIDVKQRAIIVSHQGGKTRVCAEPSPDALSAYAASVAAAAKGVDVSASSQETAAYIGLRTQTIQVLRDGMYRLCEAYLSGAFDEEQYQLQMRRYQRNMVAMLALEQLTGSIRVPPVTLTTESRAEAARSLGSIRTELTAVKTRRQGLEAENQKLLGAIDGATDAQKQAVEDRIRANAEELKALADDEASLQEAVASTRGLLSTGSTSAKVWGSGAVSRSDDAVEAVAEVIEAIVLEILGTDDATSSCFIYHSKLASNPAAAGSEAIADYCEQIFSEGRPQHIAAGMESLRRRMHSMVESDFYDLEAPVPVDDQAE